MEEIRRFAVIGNPVNHSLSPVIHQYFANQFGLNISYDKIQGSGKFLKNQVQTFFAEGGIGLNITLPFKQLAYELATHRTQRSQLSKTVNTLWMQDGQLHGDNTDGMGFIRDIQRYIILGGRRVLLVGAGGAARAILPSLIEYGAQVTIVNRTPEKAEKLALEFLIDQVTFETLNESYDIVINASSIHFETDTILLPEIIFQNAQFCYDLSYLIRGMTPFIRAAHEKNCNAADGLGMLVEQAAESFFIWNHLNPEVQAVKQLCRVQ